MSWHSGKGRVVLCFSLQLKNWHFNGNPLKVHQLYTGLFVTCLFQAAQQKRTTEVMRVYSGFVNTGPQEVASDTQELWKARLWLNIQDAIKLRAVLESGQQSLACWKKLWSPLKSAKSQHKISVGIYGSTPRTLTQTSTKSSMPAPQG